MARRTDSVDAVSAQTGGQIAHPRLLLVAVMGIADEATGYFCGHGLIGHVYEGLMEYTVAKLDEVTVGLIGSQKVRHPSTTLGELETLKSQGHEKAVERLAELTGRSTATIGKALKRGGDEAALLQLIHACGGDETLARRLLPFADLIRADSWGTMLVSTRGCGRWCTGHSVAGQS